MKALMQLAWEAFFLSEEPYAEVRDGANPALRGLIFVALIALAVALVGLVGTTVEWATTPNLSDIEGAVLEGIERMPWYRELESDPDFVRVFRQQYELGWRTFPRLFGASDPASAALRIILLPVGLVFTWFLYAVVAHLFARLMDGQGNLGQTLGCTALALTPHLLNLATFLPYVVVGGVVGTWTLLCRYLSLKTCHRLTWGRALAVTLLPYVALAVVVASFSCLMGTVTALIFGGGSQ